MARRDGSRSGCGGCLGGLGVMALLVALAVLLVLRVAPPMVADVADAYVRRALEVTGVSSPEFDESELGYLGARLDEDTQRTYLQLYAGVQLMEETFTVFETRPDQVDPAYRALMCDHPELFWLDGSCSFTYASIGDVVEVTPGVTVPLDQVPDVRAQIEAVADEVLRTLPADADEYDTAQAAYEYVVSTTDYVTDADHNQNIQSVFLRHASVCAGYARAYQYLLQRAGLFCAYVEGTITDTGEDHAWNLVRIGDQYAFVDPTWGDPAYSGETDQLPQDAIIYDYLCLTTDELERDRHAMSHAEDWPLCDAPELDYYARRGLRFDVFDEVALSEAFWRQAQEGSSMAAFKFGNAEAFAQARAALDEGSFLRDELLELAMQRGQDSIRYSYTASDSLYIIKVFW